MCTSFVYFTMLIKQPTLYLLLFYFFGFSLSCSFLFIEFSDEHIPPPKVTFMRPNFNMVLQHFQSSFSHLEHIPKTYNMHPTTQSNIALQSVSKSFSTLKDTFWHGLIYLHYNKNLKAQKGQTLNPKVCQRVSPC
jgi:hypothetical protein